MLVFVGRDLRLSGRPARPRTAWRTSGPRSTSRRPTPGLANFRYIFSDSLFIGALENNLTLFLCVPIMVVLSIILAALLFDRPRGWKVYRTLLFLPYILSIPVVGVVFSYLFTYNGSANQTLRGLGLGFAREGLARHRRPGRLPTIMFVIIWKELGFGVIICLARLMSVNEEYFEAARVDGARWWRRFGTSRCPSSCPRSPSTPSSS